MSNLSGESDMSNLSGESDMDVIVRGVGLAAVRQSSSGNVKLSEAISRGIPLVAGEIHCHHGQCPFERRGHGKIHATVIGMALLGSSKITEGQVDAWPDYEVSTHCIHVLNEARVSGEWPEEVVRDVIDRSNTGATPAELVAWLRGRGE